MVSVVFCFSHHSQVADVVVARVLVGVVDEFERIKIATQVPLHDKTMLHDVTLAVGVRMGRNQDGEVSTAAPVADALTESRMINTANIAPLPRRLTDQRTEPLAALAGAGSGCSAFGADRRNGIAPSVCEVASPRAEPLIAPVRREEVGATSGTGARCLAFHTAFYHIEERYCEIAVKRLSQEVLAL